MEASTTPDVTIPAGELRALVERLERLDEKLGQIAELLLQQIAKETATK